MITHLGWYGTYTVTPAVTTEEPSKGVETSGKTNALLS
jgi:hypothetical protein